MNCSSPYVFENLEPLEARVRQLTPDAAFLLMWDRTDRKREILLGRFDLTAAQALPMLEEPGIDLRGMAPKDRVALEARAEEGRTVQLPPDLELPFATVLDSACRWIRYEAIQNMEEDYQRRFRIKIYAPKGNHHLESGSFLCRNTAWRAEDGADEPADIVSIHSSSPSQPSGKDSGGDQSLSRDETLDDMADFLVPGGILPGPEPGDATLSPSERSMHTLGRLYSQWGRMMLGGAAQLQNINSATIKTLHRQLQDARTQLEQLLAAFINYRADRLEEAEARPRQVAPDEARTMLVRDALRQLSDTARALLGTKGLTPDMTEVLELVSESDELVSTLSSPTLRQMLRDPTHRQMLAGLLKQLVQQGLGGAPSSAA